MPGTCCCVPDCHHRGGHVFPSENGMKEKWVIAVRRLDELTLKTWTPSKSAVVCKSNFVQDDYVKQTIQGVKPIRGRLLPTAVPSIFPWRTTDVEAVAKRKSRVEARDSRKRKWDAICQEDLESSFTEEVECPEEIVSCETEMFTAVRLPSSELKNTMTQTPTQPMMSVDNFREDNAAIHFYTGLETYAAFLFVLRTLGPAAYCLRYIYFQVVGVSVENQFFMALMKLRRYTTNFEMSRFFAISEASVKNIVYTWIVFISKQWREVNIFPSQNLVRYFAPSDFKAKFPTTRIIVDGTECPVKKPKAPRAQLATFSTYKNRNTIKILVGSTPGGLTNYVSQAYAGSTSDRQIVERCKLVQSCDPGDSVMADKGFNVQDLFATMNVAVNIPTFFRKKNRMSGKIVLNDRKVSSKRVHIERIIGLAKTYKILTHPLTSTEAKLSSHITFACFMLCNFRSGIVSKHAYS